MAFKRSFNTTATYLKMDKTADLSLSEHLDQIEEERKGWESFVDRPKLVDRFFTDSEMNDLEILLRFFQLLQRAMNHSKSTAVKLIIRLPGSNLLTFAYKHLKISSATDAKHKNRLQNFVPILVEVLQYLLELHPSCWEQLDSLGIFDRLETYAQSTANDRVQLQVKTVISRTETLREQKIKKSKPKEESAADRDDPPPDDFHQLSIYPTLDEIFQSQTPYLRKNITTGQYKDGTHYLDIHFRLLREDFLHPMREAICQYMVEDNRNTAFRNANVRFYRNSILTGSVCSQTGLLFSITIDLTLLPKSIIWANSRRLIYGNLLAATFDDFAESCFLLTIEDRSNIDKNGTISVRCQKELCNHKLMRVPPGTPFTLLETTSYFEAYRPILQALQNIKDDRLPLEKYLLHCDTDVAPPNYYEEKNTVDFRPILVKAAGLFEEFDGALSNVKDLSTWPNAQQLGLDDSQYQAFQLAITKAVALIQGPPGCGKTFLGVRLTEFFYHNRERIAGCNRPILMICYTNHALDQFLSSIIQKLSLTSGQVVRVGGRSTNPQIEPFLIQKLRQQRRDLRTKNEELSSKYEILKNIKKQIETCNANYYQSCTQILTVTQLLRAMDKKQLLSFLEPILPKLDIFRNHWDTNKGGIYCCKSTVHKTDKFADSDLEVSSDSDDETKEEDDEELSPEEELERKKNRIHCQKLYDLSKDDQSEINQLFIKWLDVEQLKTLLHQINEQNEDDGNGPFEEQRKREKKTNKDRAAAVLEEIRNDSMPLLIVNDRNIVDENPVTLEDEDDEEELRRLENIDNSYIPFTAPNRPNEKEPEKVNTEQLQYVQYLLKNRTTLLSDDKVNKFKDLWSQSIDKEQRQDLYRYWFCKYIQLLIDEWFQLNEQYDETHRLMHELWLANDQLYMKDAFIIAMTTHCASRYQKVLKQIAPRICIVEEAAEVFESHIVTAIGERTEHLILIGDHVQLRPSPNVYTLAKLFNLDVSLFERLIKNKMPSVQLSVQHRSIPIISSLTHHFYDISIDNHSSVLNRPAITGMVHPLYFIDHQHFEENVADGCSKRNAHECNYLLQLADYLLHQGYEKSEITILTTYMGQRQLIQRTMNQFKQLKGIHVTVVDNFQGEENRIILLSLVRSNADQRLGYIGVDNRICVALSRAQNAFYVIGNFHLLAEKNATWKTIVSKMNQLKLIGPGLPINCANHLSNQSLCTHPNDFLKRPLGGCGLKCEARLSCGHQCPLTCHSTSHDSLICQKQCLGVYDDCGHQCQKKCHSTTICVPCHEMIQLKMPHCEHISDVPCFMRKNDILECGVPVPYKCPNGHEVQVRCCDLRNKELRDRLCNHPCTSTLECGHMCTGTCSVCLQGRLHHPCEQQELVVFICGHSRYQRCHELGPRCEEPFIKICGHNDTPTRSANSTRCFVYRCSRYCLKRCKHMRCELRCKEECEVKPCNEKCSRRFECEHWCNGICGEPCIDCLKCREKDLSRDIRTELNRNIRHANFVQLECGHLFITRLLDAHVENFRKKNFLSNGSMIIDYPRCPECQHPLVNCKRYFGLINTIHNKMTANHSFPETLSGRNRGMNFFAKLHLNCSELPKEVADIVRTKAASSSKEMLANLFIHVVTIFQKLADQVSTERDTILQSIYEHVKKNNSIFLTRQQWSDLENEYNRLLAIADFRKAEESLVCTSDKPKTTVLDDILFGSAPFTQSACQRYYSTLNSDEETNDKWQSILLENKNWDDFEKDRLVCDGKWTTCLKGIHLIWTKNINEESTCSACQLPIEQSIGLGVRRGPFTFSHARRQNYH